MDMAGMANEILANGRLIALLVLAGLMALELILQVTGFARGEEIGLELEEVRIGPAPRPRTGPRR